MNMRHHVRALVALAAAYALALQAILLAVGGPISARAGEIGALPICSSLTAGHPAPLEHTGGCPGTCLGCCCGPPLCPIPGPAMTYVPAPAHTIAVASVAAPVLVVAIPDDHRSRAPPLA